MKLDHILKEQQLIAGKKILAESCGGLTDEQRYIVEGIYNELSPLVEASIDPATIQKIFGSIEQAVTAGGNNRTMIGKGVDVAKQADAMVNKVGTWLQNTTPVKAFDQKFDQLKNKINTKFPDSKILDAISEMGMWAKENPGKTAAIIGVLTTLAALGGGPVGGAIAGQVLRGSLELLKGEKLSTAVGKGLKTAAYGWLTGKAVELVGDLLSKPVEIVASKINPNVVTADYTRTISEINGEFGDRFGTFKTGSLFGRPEDVQDAKTFFDDAVGAWKAGDYNQARLNFEAMDQAIEKMNNLEYLTQIGAEQAKAAKWSAAAENVQSFAQGMAKAAQGAVTAAGAMEKKPKQESLQKAVRPLSEGQVYLVFNRVEQLQEGPMDAIKGAVGKAAGWVNTKAGNLTTQVTADKLNSAWQKAGSPTDSMELANFLKAQGIDDAITSQVFKGMKIPTGGGATSLYAQVKADLAKLDSKGKKRLTAYLQKQLGTA